MGGAVPMLLPRSLTSRPQTTVTTIFRLSPKLLQPSKYIGMHQYHNFHDLGRNSSPIVPKLRRIPSTNYLHNPLNFGAAKIRFQVDQKFETTTSDKIPWLITSKYATSRPIKPPWTYLIIHSQLTLGKARGNSCYKTIYKTWTLIRNFLHKHTICSSQTADHHCNYDHKYLKDLSAQFYNPYGGNFSTSTCSHAILLIYRFANSPSTSFTFNKSNTCNKLLMDTWISFAQTLGPQKGSIPYNFMIILHYFEFHKTLWMLTKHQQIQSQISDLGDPSRLTFSLQTSVSVDAATKLQEQLSLQQKRNEELDAKLHSMTAFYAEEARRNRLRDTARTLATRRETTLEKRNAAIATTALVDSEVEDFRTIGGEVPNPLVIRQQSLQSQLIKFNAQLDRLNKDIQDICTELDEHITIYINDDDDDDN